MRENVAIYRITDLDESERPRERLSRLGAQSLSEPELLAILLRVGVRGENGLEVGQRLLKHFNGLPGLHRAEFGELCQEYGIGLAKAAQIKAAIELGRRLSTLSPEDRSSVHSPGDAAALVLYDMGSLDQEELWTIILDTRNRVLKIDHVYKGSLNSSQVRIGELFKSAIRQNANTIIVIHNHPSGDPSPSPDDIAVTRGIVSAGKLLDIEVLDHLVIGHGRYVSMKEKGLGF